MTCANKNLMAHVSSFRDPSGYVLLAEGRVFRVIDKSAKDIFQIVQSSGILEKFALSGQLVPTWPVSKSDVPVGLVSSLPSSVFQLVEHEVIPFISYPYEWPFTLLKRAALHYLDFHLALLESNFTLSDASAYNVQFRGVHPVFIDILSIRPYRDGDYWAGYRQFCEQFLNPLLITSINDISFQNWFRGSTEGISVEDTAKLLPVRAKLSWKVLLHVILHARMTAKSRKFNRNSDNSDINSQQSKPMPKKGLLWLIRTLRGWIDGLEPRDTDKTVWQDYECNTSYALDEENSKRSFVVRYIEHRKPIELLDLGCNNGSYSQLALSGETERVIGIDFDRGAIEGAVVRADIHRLNLLPLIIDALNPSPNQGWAQREWLGFEDRINSDGLLALAFLHHVVIGRNVPMAQAIDWLVALAPSGVIEFVPKIDPMVQQMLRNRSDVFPDYNVDKFRQELARRSLIVNELIVSSSGRTLFEFER